MSEFQVMDNPQIWHINLRKKIKDKGPVTKDLQRQSFLSQTANSQSGANPPDAIERLRLVAKRPQIGQWSAYLDNFLNVIRLKLNFFIAGMTSLWYGLMNTRVFTPVFHNTVTQVLSGVLKKLQLAFTLDLRSLALFRICVSIIFLVDLIGRFVNIEAHYTDTGAYPRSQAIEFYRNAWWSSINMISGDHSIQVILFLLAGLCGICLMLGYRTRLATSLVWFFTLSLQLRSPLLLYGADLLLRNMLFWAIFLPLGARWSLDSLKFKGSNRTFENSIFSEGTIAIMLQLCFMYIFSAFEKTDPVWRRTGDAIHYVMAGFFLSTPFSQLLRPFPDIMRVLSFGTIYLEFFGPFLALCPVANNFFRLLAILLFSGFHFFSGLFINVGFFPYISITSWFLFLPGAFWDWFQTQVKAQYQAFSRWPVFNPLPQVRSGLKAIQAAINRLQLMRWSALTGHLGLRIWVIGCLVYVFLFNLTNIRYFDFDKIAPLWSYGEGLGINQRWNMFSPGTRVYDGYFVMPATLVSGKVIDLFNHEQSVSWTEPKREGLIIDDHRWLKYFERFHGDDKISQQNRMNYGAYICRIWNRTHKGKDRLSSLRVYFAHEPILNNFTHGTERIKWLLTYNCF